MEYCNGILDDFASLGPYGKSRQRCVRQVAAHRDALLHGAHLRVGSDDSGTADFVMKVLEHLP